MQKTEQRTNVLEIVRDLPTNRVLKSERTQPKKNGLFNRLRGIHGRCISRLADKSGNYVGWAYQMTGDKNKQVWVIFNDDIPPDAEDIKIAAWSRK